MVLCAYQKEANQVQLRPGEKTPLTVVTGIARDNNGKNELSISASVVHVGKLTPKYVDQGAREEHIQKTYGNDGRASFCEKLDEDGITPLSGNVYICGVRTCGQCALFKPRRG